MTMRENVIINEMIIFYVSKNNFSLIILGYL
jgi:hypothetical protein